MVKYMKFSRTELAQLIDHTLIRSTATRDEVTQLCLEAKKHKFKCIVVNPYYISLACRMLEATGVKIGSTVGFPMGATLPVIKAREAEKAVELGATELDMVMNISAFKSKEYEAVRQDIEAVTDIKRLNPDVVIKVIIETGFLTGEEKPTACKLAEKARADFVKTSTGLFGGKATVKDVRIMRKAVGNRMGVKAAGGIRTLKDALVMIEAGANRIGTSTAVQIIEEIQPQK